MKPKFIIESIEDGFVRLENYNDVSHHLISKVSVLPENAKEGDVLGTDENGKYVILKEETLNKQENIQKKFDRLLKRGN